jgi:ankyrin repeat protein
MELTAVDMETSQENDKSKSLSPGEVFQLESVYRRRTRAGSLAKDIHCIDGVTDVTHHKRFSSAWQNHAGSFRSFCSLEEGEQDLVKEIEIKYDHQDITKREPLLHLAVRTGNLAVVEFYLDAANEKVRVKNFKGQTALHVAAELDFPDIAVLLLKYQAGRRQARRLARTFSIEIDFLSDFDTDSETDCCAPQTPMAKMKSDMLIGSSATVTDDHFLLICRDLNFFTPLSSAALNGSKNVLDILFQHAQTALVHARVWKDVLQIADLSQSSLLHLAVISRCFVTVKMCLNQGIDINLKRSCDGNTAMHNACEIGHLNMVKLLVQHDASVIEVLNHEKQTPLHRAAVFNRNEVVQYLLSVVSSILLVGIVLPLIICAQYPPRILKVSLTNLMFEN